MIIPLKSLGTLISITACSRLFFPICYKLPFNPISSAFSFIPLIVSLMTSSSSIPSISHPLRTTSRLTSAAKDLSLNFFFTDFTSRSSTLLEGRIRQRSLISPVSSSAVKSTFSILLSGFVSVQVPYPSDLYGDKLLSQLRGDLIYSLS